MQALLRQGGRTEDSPGQSRALLVGWVETLTAAWWLASLCLMVTSCRSGQPPNPRKRLYLGGAQGSWSCHPNPQQMGDLQGSVSLRAGMCSGSGWGVGRGSPLLSSRLSVWSAVQQMSGVASSPGLGGAHNTSLPSLCCAQAPASSRGWQPSWGRGVGDWLVCGVPGSRGEGPWEPILGRWKEVGSLRSWGTKILEHAPLLPWTSLTKCKSKDNIIKHFTAAATEH